MPSKSDRRINLVCLTDAAKELQDRTIDLANQTMNEALVGVNKEEIELVKQVFQKVYDNLT
jgi:DNA-binding MarR family transcriptional regulator